MQQEKKKLFTKRGKDEKAWLNLSVPEYLLCPLGGEIMEDPVLATSGQTFERSNIE